MRLTNTAGGAFGIYAPRLSYSAFEDVLISGVTVGVQTRQVYMSHLSRLVLSSCATGVKMFSDGVTNPDTGQPYIAGTSTHFDTCFATNCATGFDLDLLIYSTLTSCGVDHSTADAYKLVRSVLTLNGCGAEYGTGRVLNIGTDTLASLNAFTSVRPGEVDPAPFSDYYAYLFDGCQAHFSGSWLQTAGGSVIGEGLIRNGAEATLTATRAAAAESWVGA